MSRSFVLTGRSGMLGSEVRRVLLERGWRELRLEDDSNSAYHPTWTDPWTGVSEPDFAAPGFGAFVRRARPDVVVNAAGIVGSHKCALLGEEQTHRSNAIGAARLAEAAVDAGSVVVYFASDVEFDPDDYCVAGTHYLASGPGIHPYRTKLGARTLYGWTKHLGRTRTEAIVPRDRLIIVYPSFGFGGRGDSQSVIGAIMRTAAEVPGYNPKRYAQLDPLFRKELTWHDDVGRHVAALVERGERGKFSSTSCDGRPFGELAELVFELPGARRFDVAWRPDLDYKGDSFFDPEFARASWDAADLRPTPLEEALRTEWDRLRETSPGELLPHVWGGHLESLAAAKAGRIEFERTR